MAHNTWKTATTSGGILTETSIGNYITEQHDYLLNSGAIDREVKRWGGLAGINSVGDWETQITDLKNWDL